MRVTNWDERMTPRAKPAPKLVLVRTLWDRGGCASHCDLSRGGRRRDGAAPALDSAGSRGGVAIGAGIDALFRGRTLVYRAPAGRVTLLPSVAGPSRGLMMS